MIREGGPGSGRRPGQVTAIHTTTRPATLRVDNEIAKINNDAFFDKRPLTPDERKQLNDLELERRRLKMYASENKENLLPHASGAPYISTYPLFKAGTLTPIQQTPSEEIHHEASGNLGKKPPIGPSLMIGGSLSPKKPGSSSVEADSGSAFPQLLRGKKK